MNDVFIERMVKKKMDAKDFLIIILIILGGVVLITAGLMFLTPMLSILVIAGVCFGAYKLVTMRNLEFEYSITNGYVTVDKIMNRSTRKRLTAFECSEIEAMGEYAKHKDALANRGEQTRVMASEYADGSGSWYVLANASKTGKTLVVFDPDEEFLDAMKRFIPHRLRFEIFGRR